MKNFVSSLFWLLIKFVSWKKNFWKLVFVQANDTFYSLLCLLRANKESPSLQPLQARKMQGTPQLPVLLCRLIPLDYLTLLLWLPIVSYHLLEQQALINSKSDHVSVHFYDFLLKYFASNWISAKHIVPVFLVLWTYTIYPKGVDYIINSFYSSS